MIELLKVEEKKRKGGIGVTKSTKTEEKVSWQSWNKDYGSLQYDFYI